MRKKIKRELIEWVVLIGIIGGLYITGWHTEVLGTLQRGILATGIFTPSTGNEIGKTDYQLTLESLDGNKISLSEFRNEPIFMNFWATWCPPCIAEMPDIHNLYNETGDQINFIMISLDENPQKAIDFIKRKGFDFPVYFLRSQIPTEFQSQSIPTSFVIDSNGSIVVKKAGMAKYNTKAFREYLLSL